MKQGQTKLQRTALITAACTLLGTSALALAQTQLEIENDGLTLSAFASSEKNVLSTSIRVVGPDGFVFEDRIEDSAVQWIPEGDLADGEYRWEAWTITVEPGAPARTIATPKASMPTSSDDQATQMKATIESDSLGHEVPIERTFDSSYKRVHRESGSFRVRDGLLLPVSDREDSLSQNEPNILERGFSAVLDFVFPSAHAQQVFNTDLEIEKTAPSLYLDNTSTGANLWRIWVGASTGDLYFRDDTNANTTPLRIEQGAPADSIRISAFGNIGIGTASPSNADLHIADTTPRIRLEDTDDAQSWYIKNSNSGRFEIGETTNSGAFVIKPGAANSSITIDGNKVGIGTDNPSSGVAATDTTLDIQGDFPSLRLGPFEWTHAVNSSFFRGSNGQGIIQVGATAPAASLAINDDGNVGIRTATPSAPLSVSGGAGGVPIAAFDRVDFPARIDFVASGGNPQFRFNRSSKIWAVGTQNDRFAITATNVLGNNNLVEVFENGNMWIAGALTQNSRQASKHDIVELDPRAVLAQLETLQIKQWRYNDNPHAKHVGPMAEDWYESFGLGANKNGVALGDLSGIALVAAQGLKTENDLLKQRLEKLEAIILGEKGS